MSLPLAGIKVVDFATVLAGPFTTMLLADQGAEVIKIESPGGDSARGMGRVPDSDLSFSFLAFNRNKRSIALDITKPAELQVAHRLCEWADIIVTNMRVDTRRRRGFTYEQLSALNPRLIYVSLTGYGDDGPEANLPGADITVQARIGDIAERRLEGQPPPPHTQLFHIDMATSMLTAFAVTLALRERDQTGQGQKIETSLLQTGLSLHACQMTRVVGVDDRYGGPITGLPQTYRCADGRYILSQYINLERRWESLCDVLGVDELVSDPRFATIEGRRAHTEEIAGILTRLFLTRPAAEWETILKGAEHMMSMVKEIDEVFDDPQVIANGMLTRFQQPGVGEVLGLAPPFRMSSTAGASWFRRPAPAIGEHTDEILRELGLPARDQLRAPD
ncbi:MAG: CoA transferase [Dehalococcoidia bacterium]